MFEQTPRYLRLEFAWMFVIIYKVAQDRKKSATTFRAQAVDMEYANAS